MDKVTQGLGTLTIACFLTVGFWQYYRNEDSPTPKIQAVAPVEALSDPDTR